RRNLTDANFSDWRCQNPAAAFFFQTPPVAQSICFSNFVVHFCYTVLPRQQKRSPLTRWQIFHRVWNKICSDHCALISASVKNGNKSLFIRLIQNQALKFLFFVQSASKRAARSLVLPLAALSGFYNIKVARRTMLRTVQTKIGSLRRNAFCFLHKTGQ